MLTHPTLDQLYQLGLFGMAKAFGEAQSSAEAATLTHPEWLALLLDREMTYRHDRKLAARLRYARLRQQALVEMSITARARPRSPAVPEARRRRLDRRPTTI